MTTSTTRTREREESVGIRCFVGPRLEESEAGVGGTFKHRYTDFVVREVDLAGTTAALTVLGPVPGAKGGPTSEVTADAKAEDKSEPVEEAVVEGSWLGDAAALKELEEAVGASDAKRFREFVGRNTPDADGKRKASGPDDSSLVLEPNDDKDGRTQVHRFFKAKKHLRPQIATDTLVDGEKKHVRLFAMEGRDRKRRRGMDKRNFRDARGEPAPLYSKFLLYKENSDTQVALNSLAYFLRVKSKRFGYAGTKDKRGITLQWCTGYKISPRDLENFNRIPVHKRGGAYVGNIQALNEGRALGLGNLTGNHFTVVLRDVREDVREAAQRSVDTLGKKGFINYYGLQRFGTGGASTHEIGIELMKGNWAQACKLIVSGRENENDKVKDARAHLTKALTEPELDPCQKAGNKEARGRMKEVLRELPRGALAERRIAEKLLDFGQQNLVPALESIPHTLKMMYIHAYQSFLWNNAASRRMESYSQDYAVEGDLVFEDQSQRQRSMTYAKQDGDLPGVRCVTKEEADSKSIGIDKVILPLPGRKTRLPENSVREVYEELMARDGIDMTKSAHKVQDFNVDRILGAYRSLIHVPGNVKVDFIKYEEMDQQLLRTDLQKLRNEEAGVGQGSGEGKRMAMKLDFTLSASCYASMAVREICKGSVEGMTT